MSRIFQNVVILNGKMLIWIVIWFLCVSVHARFDSEEPQDRCGETRCVGKEYMCIDDKCYCATGYILNHFHSRCVRCPGLGDKCFSQCCNPYTNDTLRCWEGVCQICYDAYGNFICRDSLKEILLISSAQVAMGAALVLGILATFVLIYKLCAATNLRPMGDRSNSNSRLSIGSLQLYIEERLRDAPPRYTRGPTPGTMVQPTPTYYHNNGFVHDSSIPPPPYVEVVKSEEQQHNTALHI